MSPRRAFLFGRGLGSKKITSSSSAIDPIQKLRLLQREEDKGRGKQEEEEEDGGKGDCWSRMLPEILEEIIQRVESSEDRWPVRKNVVACASVCKTWREITREIVKSPQECGKITFPSSLKEPGPRDLPIQCIIKRNRKNSTFYLYLGVNESSVGEGKFLLAARMFRHGSNTEYIISLDADDFSQGSNAYVGKLCSNFMGTKFAIYDTQPPFNGAKPSNSGMSRRFGRKKVFPKAAGVFNGAKPSNSRMIRRFGRKKVFPQAAGGGNFEIRKVSYKFNLLKSRGPRRMSCALECTGKRGSIDAVQKSCGAQKHGVPSKCVILRNKAPRWHEHLQCWCLNFHGRVTVASVKNFQLVATVDPSQPDEKGDEEMVLLQFGKVGNDLFSMDYREPLSAFQAFATCLTSFGTKVACE